MLKDAVLVVAHPDDEILWFSSIIEQFREIIVVYLAVPSRPEWTEGRKRSIAAFPLRSLTSLGLTESETFNGADWLNPVTTPFGLEVKNREGTLASYSGERYRDNFDLLQGLLRDKLRGYRNVFTHNPWGEYGHEEHVQVYRAAQSLGAELGFRLWFSNYCSNKSHNLMLQHLRGLRSDYATLATNPILAERVKRLYQENDCWTWFDDYTWFTHECFLDDQPVHLGDGQWAQSFPLNYLRIETPWSTERKPRWRAVAGRVRNAVVKLTSNKP